MKQYRPNVELAKRLYSMRQSGETPEPKPDRKNIEFWLPGGVRSMADAIWISDQIKQDMEQNPPPSQTRT
jgi:hypothetical protein